MWQGAALKKMQDGKPLHKVERVELLEQGYIKFSDSPAEVSMTQLGQDTLTRFLSADYASKRY